jgi:hypothetical protein
MGSLKVGDKAIIVRCNYDFCLYKIGTILEIEPAGFGKEAFIFPYRIELEDKSLFWCRAVAYSSLIEELF